ncbi:cytochrome P450 2C15-like [Bufo gargarizans]|uniref:cytochrome P450 2C15-like n=1 Tax=Bufo gargarizans TaxID=30331 RepID=UPI001CF41BAE|nr:cytochrome P450 2C15-like [Bufo gargarizans]
MDFVLVLTSIIVILFVASAWKNQNQRNYKNFPPGPPPLPIIGNAHILDIDKPQNTLMQLTEEYGTVFSMQLGRTKTVILCGYDTIKDALVNYAEYFGARPHAPMFSAATNDYGLLFSNGENWKVMRKFTISTLRDYGMGKKTIEDKIIEESECLIKKLRSYEGKPFDDLTIINSVTTNIIVSFLLNKRFDYEDPTVLKLINIINENIRILNTPWIMLYNSYPFLAKLLPGAHNKFLENVNEFRSFVRWAFTKQKNELDVNDQRNLIDAFLVKQQEGKKESTEYFHNGNLTSLLIDLLVTGTETVSATLRWAILLMIKYPEIQQKVQNEIEQVIGSARPQMTHKKQMPYTDAVIHEIQRFADVIPAVLHSATQDFTFRGYFIPKGTHVITLVHSILRDKKHFEEPEKFDPGRFLDSDGNFKKNEAYIPFLLGKRSCVGENLATMEVFLFFTSLLQNFTLHPLPGAELDLSPGLGFTSIPKPHGLFAVPRI